jgi:hypothetical protein
MHGYHATRQLLFPKAKMLGLSLHCITLITFFSISHTDGLSLFQRLIQEHSHVIGIECDITVPAFVSPTPKNFDVAAEEACLCYLRDDTCWECNSSV